MQNLAIAGKNRSGSNYTLLFDISNFLEDGKNIGIRILTTLGDTSFSLLLSSRRSNYSTPDEFLNRVERHGIAETKALMDSSTDDGMILPSPSAHLWVIAKD